MPRTYVYNGPVYAGGHYLKDVHVSAIADTLDVAKRKLRYKVYLDVNQWVDFINPIRIVEKPAAKKPAKVEVVENHTQISIFDKNNF